MGAGGGRDGTSCLLSPSSLVDVPPVELIYLVFTCVPGDNSGDTGLCCVCVTSFDH